MFPLESGRLHVKNWVRLAKLGRIHGCNERSNRGGNGDCTIVCQVAFRPGTVLLIYEGFLLSKSEGPQGNLFFFGGNVCDWLLYFITGICFINRV